MYPLKFQNIYYEKVWGGRGLELFRDNLPKGNIGESWDIACHPHGISTIANGKFKGMNLDELIKLEGDKLLGTKLTKDWFPLLIKIISATDKLSIQVHPNDEYAKKSEGEMGKTEAWYVIEALEGANLIVGTKEYLTKEAFKKAIKTGSLDKHINKIPVKKGDVYYIKSGLIHAIGGGVILAEIQQNSDTTYRVYDYNRGRELHIKKALDVIDLTLTCKNIIGTKLQKQDYNKTHLCVDKNFCLELYDVQNSFTEKSNEERFYCFTCVEGMGEIIYGSKKESFKLGDSFLIPASLGKYTFKGTFKILKSYVP